MVILMSSSLQLWEPAIINLETKRLCLVEHELMSLDVHYSLLLPFRTGLDTIVDDNSG